MERKWETDISIAWDSSGKNTGKGVMPSSTGSSDTGIETVSLMSPVLAIQFPYH